MMAGRNRIPVARSAVNESTAPITIEPRSNCQFLSFINPHLPSVLETDPCPRASSFGKALLPLYSPFDRAIANADALLSPVVNQFVDGLAFPIKKEVASNCFKLSVSIIPQSPTFEYTFHAIGDHHRRAVFRDAWRHNREALPLPLCSCRCNN